VDTNLGLSILCVEDDADTREVIVELLKREGYEVASAVTAQEALAELAARKFHLLVADYMLPDKPGTRMIREAMAKGTLNSETAVLIFTAHPNPEKVEGTVLLRKPLAVDMFLRTVYDILAPAREAELEKAKRTVNESFQKKNDDSPRAELILYVSASSPSSLRALRNMQELLAAYDGSQVRFQVVDLSKESPASADEDRIAFTPTLVQRKPEPRTWILGDLHNIQVVIDLLAVAGISKVK
jgi:CheY-like chemotaxis protein